MALTWRPVALTTLLLVGAAACSDDTSGGVATPATTRVGGTTAAPGSTEAAPIVTWLERTTDALAEGDFTTIKQLLAIGALEDELEEREVTVLAPTDDAFTSLSRDDLADLLENPTEIDDLLRRHILDGAYTLEELKALTEVTTIGGDVLPVVVSGDVVTIAGARVTEVEVDDAVDDNLVLFELDTVLLAS